MPNPPLHGPERGLELECHRLVVEAGQQEAEDLCVDVVDRPGEISSIVSADTTISVALLHSDSNRPEVVLDAVARMVERVRAVH